MRRRRRRRRRRKRRKRRRRSRRMRRSATDATCFSVRRLRGEARSRRAHLLERIDKRLMGKKRGCTTRGCIFRDCRHGAASATRAGGGGDATLFGGQGNVDGAARCYRTSTAAGMGTHHRATLMSSWHPYLNELSVDTIIHTDNLYYSTYKAKCCLVFSSTPGLPDCVRSFYCRISATQNLNSGTPKKGPTMGLHTSAYFKSCIEMYTKV